MCASDKAGVVGRLQGCGWAGEQAHHIDRRAGGEGGPQPRPAARGRPPTQELQAQGVAAKRTLLLRLEHLEVIATVAHGCWAGVARTNKNKNKKQQQNILEDVATTWPTWIVFMMVASQLFGVSRGERIYMSLRQFRISPKSAPPQPISDFLGSSPPHFSRAFRLCGSQLAKLPSRWSTRDCLKIKGSRQAPNIV